MKKQVLLLLTGAVLSLGSFAQNTFPSNGNVGIGTASPLALLHVNDNMSVIASGDNTNHYYQFQRTGDGWINSRIGNAYSFNAYGGELVFETNSGASLTSMAERMRIKYNGNVGIGTASPNGLLQVNGTFIAGGGSANIDAVASGYSLGQLSFLANSGSFLIGWNRSAGASETSFISNQGPGWGGGFAFYNHDNSNAETQLMYIRGDGTVGIGTDNPKGYKLAVNGSIISTAVVVKTYGNWPDYVFKPSYRPLSLAALRAYVDKNRHLPEVPSESEVTKDGVNLGEMNRVLLKKVEELTLYLLEQDKKIKLLETKLNKHVRF